MYGLAPGMMGPVIARSRLLCALSLAAPACDGAAEQGAASDAGVDAPPDAPPPYRPCDQAARVGGFEIRLVDPGYHPPFTGISGVVHNAVDPWTVWTEVAAEGECQVMVGRMLRCDPPCGFRRICAPGNSCILEPSSQNLGIVTVTGLAREVVLQPILGTGMYSAYLDPGTVFPPAAPDAEIGLWTGGGVYAPFSLTGFGVEPLRFPGKGLRVVRGQPLPVEWTPPARPGAARIQIRLELARYAGIAARLRCDVPDTGSTAIPAALIDVLLDRGMSGFPEIGLTRRSVVSTTIEPGCVEFAVSSELVRDVEVEGVISCDDDTQCPGQRCVNSFCQ
jgi:hypothetical protein